jgi:adenylate cyclase
LSVVPLIDVHVAQEKTRVGDLAGAISQSRAAVNEFFGLGNKVWTGYATNVLVDALLRSGNDADLEEARVSVERLRALPIEPGVVVHELWLLRTRALLARACGEEATYLTLRDDYRKRATDLGFEGHMAMAAAMA